MGDNKHTTEKGLQAVRRRIRAAEEAAGRAPGSVELLAVSKGQPPQAIVSAAKSGQERFGESYLREALDKQEAVQLPGLEWHFIGPIQSNKTRGIAGHFHWVQSVDRPKLLQRLDRQRPDGLPPLQVCLQVNISGERQKSGCEPRDLAALAEAAAGCSRLRLRGLMTIPAPAEDPAEQRAAFARVRELFERLRDDGHELDTLSMGMSADLEQAIAEGATMVRVGTAVFGSRNL